MKKPILFILLAVVVLVALWGMQRGCVAKSHTVVRPPEEYAFHCRACDAQWEADFFETAALFPSGIPSFGVAVPCQKCKVKAAFLMERCPHCGERHRVLKKSSSGTLNCPHCGKDILTWRRKS